MSRAFVKEDVDPPERPRRARQASGLPPGATNYITASGARRLRDQLERFRRDPAADPARINDLQYLLASVTIVEPGAEADNIAFGAKVNVRDGAGHVRSYRIVGLSELEFYPDAVSWISTTGKALLAAEIGDRVTADDGERLEIVSVEYPTD